MTRSTTTHLDARPNPHSVPCTYLCEPAQLDLLDAALSTAVRVAIDTEVPIAGPGKHLLRVASIATRDPDGNEHAFVFDARDIDAALLAPLFTGITADAWNASFDARVLDAAVWGSSDTTRGLSWWDAQLADALLHQGRSGFNWFHGLAWATGHYLGVEAEGKGTVQLSYTAHDDLTEDQIAYAAADAVETLWVSDAIRAEIEAAGLVEICDIEMRARPFLDQMERTGLPFDWPSWSEELETIEGQHRATIGRLADLTGGGQGTLFDSVVEPSWNPASDQQVRKALNEWATADVAAWTAMRHGKSRPLADTDSVTAGVLREIGGELSNTLLEFRNYAKILTTYGESVREHLDDDGRLRPQYLQVVGTNTGRLASRNPNAQNFTPRMKPHFRPAVTDRVFVHADLSQAELRFLAQVSDDAPLRAAFERGEDVHVSTAASMFRFEPAELEAQDPSRFKQLRQIAKALNFGIAYGTGAAALARSLTANGTPTTVDEGRQLLAQYRETYPGTAAWANERIAEIHALRSEVTGVDWVLTMRLARFWAPVESIRREFRGTNGRWPNAEEITNLLPVGQPHLPNQDDVEWVLGYSAPVALLDGGEPFTFASRTVAGRRQQFNLHVDRLFLMATIEAIGSTRQALIDVRSRFEAEHGLLLHRSGTPMTEAELARQFEERSLRRRYLEAVSGRAGRDVAEGYLTAAAKERVSAMVNAWRNAPIQGGVADIMLVAYDDLHQRLRQFPGAVPVQTVHDSVVVECDRNDALAVQEEVRAALESASLRFCPDVRPKADVDLRASLADADIIDPDEFAD